MSYAGDNTFLGQKVARQTVSAKAPVRDLTVKAVASVPATTDKIKIGINGTTFDFGMLRSLLVVMLMRVSMSSKILRAI